MGTRSHELLVLAGTLVILFGAEAYVVLRVRDLRHEAALTEQSVMQGISHFRELMAAANDAQHDRIGALSAALAAAGAETVGAAGKAATEAERYTARMAGRVIRTRRNERAWVNVQLIGLRQSAVDADEVASRLEQELSQTKAAIADVSGADAGANAAIRELPTGIDALKDSAADQGRAIAAAAAAGERVTFQFQLKKSRQPSDIGGVSILLRKADEKTQRYTLGITLGGRTVEIDDRTPDEPVRLYTSFGQPPLELVISEIGKDEIHGSLAIPKPAQMARGYSSGSAETDSFPVR